MITRKTKTMAPTRPHKMLTRWFPCSVLKEQYWQVVYWEYLAVIRTSHYIYLVSESKSTIEFEFFPSMSVFPSCAARVIGPFKSETFQPRLSCLQFGAIDICTILPHSLNIQIQILISTYFQHQGLSNDWYYEHTVKLKSNHFCQILTRGMTIFLSIERDFRKCDNLGSSLQVVGVNTEEKHGRLIGCQT